MKPPPRPPLIAPFGSPGPAARRRRSRDPLIAALLWTLTAATACQSAPQPAPEVPTPGQEAQDEPMNPMTPPGDLALSALGASFSDDASKIIDGALATSQAYNKLEALCLEVGPRLSGSPALDEAIRWSMEELKKDGHDKVRAEPAMVPRWVRGAESAAVTAPRAFPLTMLGLGGSVGTPKRGLEAEVVVVANEEELEAAAPRIEGRIVLFNNPMPPFSHETGTGYGHTVRFRVNGADMASAHGALAVLVRSVTARSLNSPHTGMLSYKDEVPRIPAAAITTEDADTIAGLVRRGHAVKVKLSMEARNHDPVPSANVVAELTGREAPEEVVVISGHLDSWDVGHGAHDDGAGCVIAMEALSVLRRLGMTPRRTLRVVLWTNEENGLMGAKAYAQDHAGELRLHAAAVESDSGGFDPASIAVHHQDPERQARAAATLEGLLPLFAPVRTGTVLRGFAGADVGVMLTDDVPLLGLVSDPSQYFDYHHSHADTFDKIDKAELDRSVAAMALLAFILAEMPGRLGDLP